MTRQQALEVTVKFLGTGGRTRGGKAEEETVIESETILILLGAEISRAGRPNPPTVPEKAWSPGITVREYLNKIEWEENAR